MSDNSLIGAKQPDRFEHESPIRAFTTFDIHGAYAIGKGFRPSLKHLAIYLNAMQEKEGWSLVQIIEAEAPTIIFRKLFSGGLLRLDPAKHASRPIGKSPLLGEPYTPGHWGDGETPDDVYVTMAGAIGGAKEVTSEQDAQQDADDIKAGKHDVAQSFHKFTKLAAETPPVDDPINPRHYGGTACAEIIENMTGNLAHAIPYIWRAGEKPGQPERQDIGKALWYLDRELHFADFDDLADDDVDEDDDRVPADALLPGQERYYWLTSHPWKKPKGKLGALSAHPFFKFVMERVPDNFPPWRHEFIRNLTLYTMNKKTAALKAAIAVAQRRADCLDDESKCGEFGRQMEA